MSGGSGSVLLLNSYPRAYDHQKIRRFSHDRSRLVMIVGSRGVIEDNDTAYSGYPDGVVNSLYKPLYTCFKIMRIIGKQDSPESSSTWYVVLVVQLVCWTGQSIGHGVCEKQERAYQISCTVSVINLIQDSTIQQVYSWPVYYIMCSRVSSIKP